MLFSQLPIGARFEFRGRRYEKLALSLARDEDRCGNIFLDYTEVVPAAFSAPPREPSQFPAPPISSSSFPVPI